MGAIEYSWYWGGESNAVVKAFTEVKLLAPYALMSDKEIYNYEIQWEGMGSFPSNDLRVSQPRKYTVNIALISKDNRRVIDLQKDLEVGIGAVDLCLGGRRGADQQLGREALATGCVVAPT